MLSGDNGLLGALQKALPGKARAELRKAISAGAIELQPLIDELAQKSFRDTLAAENTRKPPVVIIAVDQAEELFRADGAEESATFLKIVRNLAAQDDLRIIVLFVIRSDSYDRLEHASALEGMAQSTLPLLPLARGNYQVVIEGPLARERAAGHKLAIEPELTERLLEDVEKGGAGDALPLLAFALEQLYVEYGQTGVLRLADFTALGSLEGIIAKSVERAFARADGHRGIPQDRVAREALLRRGLVPWLAGIDPDTHGPRRNIALRSDIPFEARELIDLLVDERLLVADMAMRDGFRVETLEPAHEALLRQWGLLKGWLADDLGRLAVLEGVRRAARDWDANARAEAWLATAPILMRAKRARRPQQSKTKERARTSWLGPKRRPNTPRRAQYRRWAFPQLSSLGLCLVPSFDGAVYCREWKVIFPSQPALPSVMRLLSLRAWSSLRLVHGRDAGCPASARLAAPTRILPAVGLASSHCNRCGL